MSVFSVSLATITIGLLGLISSNKQHSDIDACQVVWRIRGKIIRTQGSYRSGKTGKSQGICVVRAGKGQGKILFLKSGKMILDHAD